jgi:glycosyltransferase involved in cell wall biosynthesis
MQAKLTNPNPIKVTHLITCLEPGGAENMLYRVLERTDRVRFTPNVISMMGKGTLGIRMERELGIPVRALGIRRGIPNPAALVRLSGWLKADRPSVLATWMYHANFLGSLAAKLAGGVPVVWGLHHSRLDPGLEKRRTIWIARACGWLSHRAASQIICCSQSTLREHLRMDYDARKLEVIPNGFDLRSFAPDPDARGAVRQSLGIAGDAPMIILAARFHPQKDHRNFAAAAARVKQRFPDVRFLLCGDGVDPANTLLAGWLAEAGIAGRTTLLGKRNDVARLMAASDAACLSSVDGEAFPLVIGEAMACGVPCVVTDVGDSAFVVGDTGVVVPPQDPEALAEGLASVLALPEAARLALGARARRRILDHFELSHVVRLYETVYLRAAMDVPGSVENTLAAQAGGQP